MNKVHKFAFTAALAVAFTFTLNACGSDDNSGGDGGGDISSYKTVKIGEQTWMAENLNYDVDGSKCYGDDKANCAKYGRLYDWATAKTVCTSGWHLPSNDEWKQLIDWVESDKGCTGCAGNHLKAKSGWNSDGNGLDTYGFSALPGGYGSYLVGTFKTVGDIGWWWSSSEYNSSTAYSRPIYSNQGNITWVDSEKAGLNSVRCVKD
jgi:uncharacterized protein (TIGR02145 family)